jgi:tetratricopeptide (TPR) repeat protein
LRVATAIQGPKFTRPAATTFRNPFSIEPDSPQPETELLQGPRGRWQVNDPLVGGSLEIAQEPAALPSLIPAAAPTALPIPVPPPSEVTVAPSEKPSAKAAILTAGAESPVNAAYPLLEERLPQFDVSHVGIPNAPQPPNSTPETIGVSARPIWPGPSAREQRSPSFLAESFNRDVQPGAPRLMEKGSASPIEQTALEQSPPATLQTDTAIPIGPNGESAAVTEPELISNSSDSPHASLAEAQAAARVAQTPDELLSVARLCERVAQANPPANRPDYARQLAAWAHNRRGELLSEADQSAEALLEFQVAIEQDPRNSLAIHNRAVTYAQQNNFGAALADFNRVIELNPGLAVACRNRAELLAAQGRSEEAIADYSRSIEAMPDDAELYRARAYAWQQLNEFEPALSDLGHAIRIAPAAADGYTQRGNLLADGGLFDRALNDFKQALAIDPELAEAHRGVAWIKATCPDETLRDAVEAIVAAQKAVQLSSHDDYLALEALAAAHANAAEFDKAISAQEQAINAAPPEAIQSMRSRLDLYRKHEPYRSGQHR